MSTRARTTYFSVKNPGFVGIAGRAGNYIGLERSGAPAKYGSRMAGNGRVVG